MFILLCTYADLCNCYDMLSNLFLLNLNMSLLLTRNSYTATDGAIMFTAIAGAITVDIIGKVIFKKLFKFFFSNLLLHGDIEMNILLAIVVYHNPEFIMRNC